MIKVSKGEQKIIYKKQGNIFGCYHIKVLGKDRRYITAIDLDDKEIEKTFNTSRVLEVLDVSTPEEVIQEKLNNHLTEYNNRKLPSSFTHGGFFSKAKGYIDSDGDLVLKLKGSRQTLERDIKVFKLIIYYFQTTGKASMGDCKKFFRQAAAGLLGYDSDYELDDYDFTADGKKDIIDDYKLELEESKDYLKELIDNCKEDGIDPETDEEVISQKEAVSSQQEYLKIVRSDFRQELINYFCRAYYRMHDDAVFHDIRRDFPIKFDAKTGL